MYIYILYTAIQTITHNLMPILVGKTEKFSVKACATIDIFITEKFIGSSSAMK